MTTSKGRVPSGFMTNIEGLTSTATTTRYLAYMKDTAVSGLRMTCSRLWADEGPKGQGEGSGETRFGAAHAHAGRVCS